MSSSRTSSSMLAAILLLHGTLSMAFLLQRPIKIQPSTVSSREHPPNRWLTQHSAASVATSTPFTSTAPLPMDDAVQDDRPTPLNQILQRLAPRISDEFVQSIDKSGGGDSEINQRRADIFAGMAVRILMARGVDIIADDFTYYSKDTGYLSKQQVCRSSCLFLTKLLFCHPLVYF